MPFITLKTEVGDSLINTDHISSIFPSRNRDGGPLHRSFPYVIEMTGASDRISEAEYARLSALLLGTPAPVEAPAPILPSAVFDAFHELTDILSLGEGPRELFMAADRLWTALSPIISDQHHGYSGYAEEGDSIGYGKTQAPVLPTDVLDAYRAWWQIVLKRGAGDPTVSKNDADNASERLITTVGKHISDEVANGN